MTDQTYLNAAQGLIKRLNSPAQAHSVWIASETEELDGVTRATGRHQLCISIRPEWKDRVSVPRDHAGISVVEVPWPKGG